MPANEPNPYARSPGRVLTRRALLKISGLAGLGLLSACGTPPPPGTGSQPPKAPAQAPAAPQSAAPAAQPSPAAGQVAAPGQAPARGAQSTTVPPLDTLTLV